MNFQFDPPEYHLARMNVSVTLFIGLNDTQADPTDIRNHLIPQLTSDWLSVELEDFTHLDFIFGLRAPAEVYKPIINAIDEKEKNHWNK